MKKNAVILVSGYQKANDMHFDEVVDRFTTESTEVYTIDLLNPYIPELFEYDLIIAQAERLIADIKEHNYEHVRIIGQEIGAGIAAYISSHLEDARDKKTIIFNPVLFWDPTFFKTTVKKAKVVDAYDGTDEINKDTIKQSKVASKINDYFMKEIYKVNPETTKFILGGDYKVDLEKTTEALKEHNLDFVVKDTYRINQLTLEDKKEFFNIINETWGSNFK